jgi:flagellar hook assembly protein FlgD
MTCKVDLSIYNLLGQKMVTLVLEKQKAGKHQVEWDASGFASGIYYYMIKAGEFRQVKKMVLVQ